MFLLTLIPLAWGYFLATRLLRESQRWLRWSLAYALGLLSFLAAVNALFHVLPLRPAVYLSLALLLLGSALLFRLPGLRTPPSPLGPVEGPVLALLALTAFFEALFWQMQWSDDDYFLHAPLMALALRDVFPTQNPFLPDLPLIGHYGRDLAIAALSVLFGEHFLAVQYFVTAANQAAAVLVVHGMARRFLRSPTQALWAVLFAFAGVNYGSRRGLIETFQNNNSFAFLFLFVSLYLFLTTFTRRSLTVTVLAGLAFGTFALIYETSYGLLAIAFAAFPFVLCALRRRWRLRYFTVTGGLLLLSVALALVQGGTLTELPKRYLAGEKADIAKSVDERRMTHEIRIRIPKPGFTITSPFTAEEYPLWSWRLEEDGGMFISVLPLTALLMLWRRKPWGILIAGLSVVAILIPASIDFPGLNSESLRFVLVGGVGAAMLVGVVSGMIWEVARRRGSWTRWIVAVGVAGMAALSFWPSAKVAFRVINSTAQYPRDHYLVGEEWGCSPVQPRRPCEPIDVSAAVALRSIVQKGDRVLADFRGDYVTSVMQAEATFMTFARAFLAGPGVRTLRDGTHSQDSPSWEGEGFRARVFLETGETSVLDDLRVTYVYVNPQKLARDVYRRIQENPRLERVLHLETGDGAAVREAYRLKPAQATPVWLPLQGFRVVSAEPPARLEPRRAYPVPLVLSGEGEPGDGVLRVSYDVRFPDDRLVTQNDEVRLPVALRPTGPGRWTGTLSLATPWEAGEYNVRLYGWDGNTRFPLLGTDGQPAVLRVRVEES